MKLRDKVIRTLLTLIVILLIDSSAALNSDHVHQEQLIQHIDLDQDDLVQFPSSRVRRDTSSTGDTRSRVVEDMVESSVFPLNNSHLHLMVHWAGSGSSVVFCLARDQVKLSKLKLSLKYSFLFKRSLILRITLKDIELEI